jgi:hypothetical protein
MFKRGAWIILAAALLVLATPRTGSAGIGEWIWEMSGPQFIGGGIECKVTFTWELEICYVTLPVPAGIASQKPKVRYRLSIEGGFYGSTGKDSNGVEYEAGDAWMFAFDPMIELVHHDNFLSRGDRAEIYHGLGFSYNRLWGGDFDAFNNAAIKLRPIGVRFGRNNLEFDLRIYPNRFNASDFGKVSLIPEGTGGEVVWSLSYGIAIGKYK